MTATHELEKHYLQVLDITPAEARENANHLLKHIQAVDKNGIGYTSENMKPIARILEYIENPEKTDAFVEYCNKNNKEPEWANDGDFGLKGFMIPYLAKEPEGHDYVKNVLAVVENSEYYNQDKKPVLLISEIDMISDKSFT